MSLKRMLGLEQFPLDDQEIMRQIAEARRNNINIIEFSSGTKRARINISGISPEGMMYQWQDYWGKWW